MKQTFLIKDKSGNDYRVISKSLTAAIQKVTSEHGISESDIDSTQSYAQIGTISL